MTFHPSVSMTIAIIPALVLLVLLGNWQVHRLHWKTELIAQIHAAMTDAPVPLSSLGVDGAAPPAWKKVRFSGHFLNVENKRWFGTFRGGPGYKYMQAFALDDGPVILVNRGFAPEYMEVARANTEAVTLVGITRDAGHKPFASVGNDAKANIWLWVDLPSMAPTDLQSGQTFDSRYFVELIAPDDTGTPLSQLKWPLPMGHAPELPNNHLDYALTWYGLALVLLVIYFVWHWRAGRMRL